MTRVLSTVCCLGLLLAVLHTGEARAQDAALPPPVDAAPPAAAPAAAPADGEFSPYQPAPSTTAPATPSAPSDPSAAPQPGAAAPAAPAEAPPPGITVSPMEQPATAQPAAPSPAAPPAAKTDACKETPGTGKGFFRGTIPVWAAGAVAGGAAGALGLSLVGLMVAMAINFAVVRQWVPTPSSQLPGIYALPLVALPLGAVAGAVVGGLVAPFLPVIPLTKPCLKEPGSDPTLRPSGQGSGSPGTGTAG